MTPNEYAKKIRALRFLDKKLKEIDNKGSTILNVGNTGYSYVVQRNDVHHYDMKAKRELYAQEINAYQLVRRDTIPAFAEV